MATTTRGGGYTVRVEGLREFLHATDRADKATKKLVRDELRKAAEPVREEARRLFERYDVDSASTYGISVRKVGLVTVEQRKRKTSGTRPDYGRLQMSRALYPAAETEEGTVTSLLEQAVDRLADQFERRP